MVKEKEDGGGGRETWRLGVNSVWLIGEMKFPPFFFLQQVTFFSE